ncbi:MAG: glycosyltransferase [Rikenellaceae bacterium]|nr:glycosyltransferase [Rikenellaceae bacterium]
MATVGVLLFIFAVVSLTVSAYNYFSRPYLPKNIILEDEPFVSILIPARNEENNIARLLDDLRKLDYRNLEVIVYNDNSTDNTARIVEDKKLYLNIKLINAGEPEKGWTGKKLCL